MSENNDRGIDLAAEFILPETNRYIDTGDATPRCPVTWATDEDDGAPWQCSLEPDHSGDLHVGMAFGFLVTDEGPRRALIPVAIWRDEGVLFA